MVINPTAPRADHEFEGEIDRYAAMLGSALTLSERQTAWQWLCEAHQRRSAHHVRLMEQDQSLLR